MEKEKTATEQLSQILDETGYNYITPYGFKLLRENEMVTNQKQAKIMAQLVKDTCSAAFADGRAKMDLMQQMVIKVVYRRRTRRTHKVGPEHRIQNDIIAMLRMHRCSVMRVNAGTIKTQSGSYFKGVENGTPDLIGYRWRDKQIFFIEVKAPKGRIRPDQLAYHQDLMHHNVIHGIARSVDDALKIIDEDLVGYGYPDYEENK